ncbi:hypothetical protein ANCCEY_08127 [Ancylostoma ceylanicum]|uniref:Uncharacterized protein n=1 Tax=Ancylostoma ceylanicum TaxID=53326 RepID=A0A0D6LS05_9BILA|nr:hypothetical protein ANCCEY_08127 [Ancylostoma ceylanicum]
MELLMTTPTPPWWNVVCGGSNVDPRRFRKWKRKVNRYFKNGHEVLWPHVEQALTNPKYAVL